MVSQQSAADLWGSFQENLDKLKSEQGAEVNLLVDPETYIILGVRGAVEPLLGFSVDALTGADVLRLRPHGSISRRDTPFGPPLLSKRASYNEVTIGCANGKDRKVALQIQEVQSTQGSELLFLRMLDVAEQLRINSDLVALHRELREAYAQIREQRTSLDEARRAASLSQFAAGLAHELNNPTGSALSNLNSLEEYLRDLTRSHFKGVKAPVELTESFGIVQDVKASLTRVAELVKRLGELEAPLRRERFDLVELLKTQGRKVGVRTWKGPRSVSIETDSLRFLGILQKVMDNAVFAAGKNGQVSVQLRSLEAGVEVQVDDSGQGLNPEVLERVFDPFFTTKPPGVGLGLGLFLARRAVETLGGNIRIENRAEGGARVTFQIPNKLPERLDLTASYEGFRVKKSAAGGAVDDETWSS